MQWRAADACSNLGVLHESGDGVTKDLKLAMTLYQRGCDEGSLLGCTNLGAMYTNGVGVPKDEALAVKLDQSVRRRHRTRLQKPRRNVRTRQRRAARFDACRGALRACLQAP